MSRWHGVDGAMVKMSLEKKLKQVILSWIRAYPLSNKTDVEVCTLLPKVEKDVLEELGVVAQKMMYRHGELIAELNDQAYNLAPPKSNVEMRVIDYDDVEEAVDSFYNDLVSLLVEQEGEK